MVVGGIGKQISKLIFKCVDIALRRGGSLSLNEYNENPHRNIYFGSMELVLMLIMQAENPQSLKNFFKSIS